MAFMRILIGFNYEFDVCWSYFGHALNFYILKFQKSSNISQTYSKMTPGPSPDHPGPIPKFPLFLLEFSTPFYNIPGVGSYIVRLGTICGKIYRIYIRFCIKIYRNLCNTWIINWSCDGYF